MSNFKFLVQDKNLLIEYPWFQILYERGREMESEFIRGRYNSFYHTVKTALEYATNKYVEVSGCKVKRIQKDTKDKKHSNSNETFHLDALESGNADIPSGALIVRAHMNQQWLSDTMRNMEYEEDGDAKVCLLRVHAYLVWIYCQVTNQDVDCTFDEGNMEVEYSESLITKGLLKRVRVTGKDKHKKKLKGDKEYNFVIVNGIMRIMNRDHNVIFSFSPVLHKREKQSYDKQQLVKSLVVANQYTGKLKELEPNIEEQVTYCKQLNQYGLRQLQIYADQYELEENKKRTILGRISKKEQDENYALGVYLNEIQQMIKDQTNCVVEIAKAIKMETSNSTVLHDRVMELTAHAQELLDELSNTDLYGCYDWFGKKFQLIEQQLVHDDAAGAGYRSSVEQLHQNYQYKINQATFRYAMESFLWDMREENFREDIDSLWSEIDEEKLKHTQQKELNRRLQESAKKLRRTNTILKCVLILLLLLGAALCLWKIKWSNTDSNNDQALIDDEMYEQAIKQERNGFVDENGVEKAVNPEELEEDSEDSMNDDADSKQDKDDASTSENSRGLEESGEVPSEEKASENKQEKKEDSMESTAENGSKTEKAPEKEARRAYVQNGIFQDPTNSYQMHIPDGWEYYDQSEQTYLADSNGAVAKDRLIVSDQSDVAFDKMSLKYAKNDFGYDDDKDIYDVTYTTCAGLPAIRITYWEGVLNGNSYEDSMVVKYYIKGDKKDYEFEFVENDRSENIYETSKNMMDSITFMQEKPNPEVVSQLLTKLTEDMLEAFYVRRDENDLSMFVTDEYYHNNRETIQKVLFREYENFHYKIAIDQIGENNASGTVETSADHRKTGIKNIQFQKIGNDWKVSYFGK